MRIIAIRDLDYILTVQKSGTPLEIYTELLLKDTTNQSFGYLMIFISTLQVQRAVLFTFAT